MEKNHALGSTTIDLNSINVVRKMKEKMKCCFCEKIVGGLGNNALPIKNDRCCDKCNIEFVVPIRILQITNSPILQSLREGERLSKKLKKEYKC